MLDLRSSRNIVIKPLPEAAEPAGACWKIRKAIYGLADAPRLFYENHASIIIEAGKQRSGSRKWYTTNARR